LLAQTLPSPPAPASGPLPLRALVARFSPRVSARASAPARGAKPETRKPAF